jgi:hypothetical protein
VCIDHFDHPVTVRIVSFLRDIGLEVESGVSCEPTFLPGIAIVGGVLLVDESRLDHPGDLLHEAGHLALKSPAERRAVTMNMGSDAGEEMGAIAWSYAAARYLGLDPAVVFHDEGYRGSSQALIENFNAGRYLGVPMLHYRELSVEPRQAAKLGPEPYPAMLRWIRDA